MATAKFNASVIPGDTLTRTFTLRNKQTKVPRDLTGVTISGTAIKDATVVNFTCSIVGAAANGTFKIQIAAGTTATMELGIWQQQIKFTYADATVETLMMGNLVVGYDV